MLKNLLFSLLFLINFVYANISMHSPAKFYVGEPVIFTLEAIGNNILFPKIENIEGFIVTKNGSSSSLTIINGQRNQNLLQQYKFYPNKTIIIPSFKIIIDNKEYFTQKKEVKKINVQKTKSKYIDFTIDVTNKELYVGEQTIFTLIFKYRKDLQIVDLGFTEPVFSGFWSKQLTQPKKYDEGLFIVQELKYVIFPQKSGKIDIPALRVDVSLLDDRDNGMSFFGPPRRVEKIYSNELNLNVKNLPKNIFLIGEFTISDTIDKKVIKAGDALNFEIQIQGRGNIDDVPELTLDIPNATIYENKAVKTYDMTNGIYGGVYKKSFSIVASEDIEVPSITLKYFDIKDKTIKELKTLKYDIKVEQNSVLKNEVQLYKQQKSTNVEVTEVINVIKTTDNQKILYFFFGFIVSALIFGLLLYVIKLKAIKNVKELPLEKEVKKAKSISELLNILISYINVDDDLDKLIYALEKNKNEKFKEIKNNILVVIKQKEIKS